MNEKIIKFHDSDIGQYKFQQYKSPISISLLKQPYFNKVSFGEKDFKYFIDYKDAKKTDLYAYCFQK